MPYLTNRYTTEPVLMYAFICAPQRLLYKSPLTSGDLSVDQLLYCSLHFPVNSICKLKTSMYWTFIGFSKVELEHLLDVRQNFLTCEPAVIVELPVQGHLWNDSMYSVRYTTKSHVHGAEQAGVSHLGIRSRTVS